jgi:hypothetical protein
MKKRNMEKYWKKKAEQYRDYAGQLKAQRDDAFNQLKDLSVGLASSGFGTTWDHKTKMQYDAATFLKKQASKSVEEPKGYFYP